MAEAFNRPAVVLSPESSAASTSRAFLSAPSARSRRKRPTFFFIFLHAHISSVCSLILKTHFLFFSVERSRNFYPTCRRCLIAAIFVFELIVTKDSQNIS